MVEVGRSGERRRRGGGTGRTEAWTAGADGGYGGGGRAWTLGGRPDDAGLEGGRAGWSEMGHGLAIPGPRETARQQRLDAPRLSAAARQERPDVPRPSAGPCA